MNTEIEKLVAKTTNPAALGRLLRHAATRLDQIRRELFPSHVAATDAKKEGRSDGV